MSLEVLEDVPRLERPRPGVWVRCARDVDCRWGPCRCALRAGHASRCVCPHGYEAADDQAVDQDAEAPRTPFVSE